jgi:putative FmdB family regulatory protein
MRRARALCERLRQGSLNGPCEDTNGYTHGARVLEFLKHVPTYTYKCTACDEVIEKRQSFSDARLTTCEQCGGALRKVIHPVGIVFKGSGWYITDSRSASANGRSGSATSDKESSSKSSDAGDARDAGSSKDSSASSKDSSASSKDSSASSSASSSSSPSSSSSSSSSASPTPAKSGSEGA